MKTNHTLIGLITVFSLVISACGVLPKPSTTVTDTPKPSDTPLPTSTSTPTYTNTPKPTKTPTIKPTLALGDQKIIAEGGYTFRPPTGYIVDVQGAQVGVFDQAGTIIISIIGSPSYTQKSSAEEMIDEFLTAVFNKGDGEYEKENQQTINVDGVEGLSYDITGTLFGSPLQGQAIIVMPNNHQYFFGFGIANTGNDKKRWENKASDVFNGLVKSITFSTTDQSHSSNECAISTDNTYGYTKENPVKVGGGDFGGPARERAYLDNLLGANGEKTSYERTGSFTFGDTILDSYEITVGGKKSIIYIDEYSFTEPQAPVGFTCVSAFPLAKP
jgi:hypothetical protein